ncbi:hypothetical protein [Natronorubrum sulfidifaciens]|uniref:Uncharacterized protein n=1 Tax=Natronorubrum sulfidifaciens JCM 14089 TaxID=1230460 RepID=L9W5C4_9EURY|nr:hypothetical protein [Natronorubrum sulfidifaciens]ELY44679.1 hypothetical protein C495_09864 [Natronorubrum sulfidifaciens JCM 14089]
MGSAETDEPLESHGTDIGSQADSLTRVREWVLVEGDRTVIAASISLLVFGFFLGLIEIGIISVTNDDSVTRLAGGMIAGTFSLVTLVVSINQLILSQEFASGNDARDQLEGIMDIRSDIATQATVPATPASPTKLLELLIETIATQASELADTATAHDDEHSELIQRFVHSIEASTERTHDTLEHTTFGTFTAVSTAIGYDAAWQLYVARQLRGRYDDSSETATRLEALIETLELFLTAREHFKTTYLQRELTRFSQLTIYCGIPAVLAAMTLGLLYGGFSGTMISGSYLPYVVSALIAVVVSPLSLLASYILRTAAVTHRTASIGPMLPQKEPDAGPFEVSADGEPDS